MNRLNIFLLIVVLGCALSAVSASNKQRQIFINVQGRSRKSVNCSKIFRSFNISRARCRKRRVSSSWLLTSLKMLPVTTGRTQYLNYDPATSKATDAPLPAPVPASAPPARGVKR